LRNAGIVVEFVKAGQPFNKESESKKQNKVPYILKWLVSHILECTYEVPRAKYDKSLDPYVVKDFFATFKENEYKDLEEWKEENQN
jgi:hypothetical protein